MRFQIRERGRRQIEVQPEFTQLGDDTIIASAHWLDADGASRERFQVLTLRNAKIVDLQGCATRRQAERFARRKRTS